MATDAQATAIAWATQPLATPAAHRQWLNAYIDARWGAVPFEQQPSHDQMGVDAIHAFTALPWGGVPLGPVEELRLEELFALHTTHELGPLQHSIQGDHAYRPVSTSVLHRVLAYSKRVRPVWPRGLAPHQYEYVVPAVSLTERFRGVRPYAVEVIEQEIYRRDVAAYGVYQRSGAPRHFNDILPAGPFSPLQYLIASFLSPRMRHAPQGGPYKIFRMGGYTDPDQLPRGPLAALPVQVLARAERVAESERLERELDERIRLKQLNAAPGSKRKAGEEDPDANKRQKDDEEEEKGSGAG